MPSDAALKSCALCGRAFDADDSPLGTSKIETASAGKHSSELPNAVAFITDSPLNGGLVDYSPPPEAPQASALVEYFYIAFLAVAAGLIAAGVDIWLTSSKVFLHDLLSPSGIDLQRVAPLENLVASPQPMIQRHIIDRYGVTPDRFFR